MSSTLAIADANSDQPTSGLENCPHEAASVLRNFDHDLREAHLLCHVERRMSVLVFDIWIDASFQQNARTVVVAILNRKEDISEMLIPSTGESDHPHKK